MKKPSVAEGLDFINYNWLELGLRVMVERYDNDGSAELTFYKKNGVSEFALYKGKVNLLSTQTQNSLVKRLKENDPEAPWVDILTSVSIETVDIARRGEPVVPIGKKPESMKVEYQLEPILEKNQPTTIYSPGGHAKSYIAAYIACLVQFNTNGISDAQNNWKPLKGNVLYLDWEASKNDHERRVWAIKQGLGIDTEDTFLYRFCHQPLVSDIYSIQRLVSDNNINLTIIDSQMAASGYGHDPSQVSSQYYNALRSLRCTTLTLDHVSKAEWGKTTDSDNSTGPYGSVVKFNRSRSQFEIKKSQTAGDNHIEIALIHRKHNEGRLMKPMGLRIEFTNNSDNELEKVTFSTCDIKDNPELSKAQTLRDRLIDLLKDEPGTVKELADKVDKPEGTIRMELNRKANKKIFAKSGDQWGLLALDY
ncbi:AAA family ATPase [Chloroflexota bacterium]